MANTTLAPQSPSRACWPARPCPWGPCTGPDVVTSTGCSSNLHVDRFDVNRCPLRCYKPQTNLCFWPPRYTGGERSCYTLLGTARGWVSQCCNTFISLSLISNLSLPPLHIALDGETSANKEGICSCPLKDNPSFIFSFGCYCCR